MRASTVIGRTVCCLVATAASLLGSGWVAHADQPSAASAVPDYLIVTEDTSVFASGAESALCPSGGVALSGGAVGTGDVEDFRLINSNPTDADSAGWRTGMRNLETGGSGVAQVKVHAVCAARPAGFEIVANGFTSVGPGQSILDADCPSGKVILGGGFVGNGNVTTAASTPKRTTGWSVTFRNDTQTTQQNVAAYAVCGQGFANHRVVESASFTGTDKGSVSCPAGMTVVGGGYTNASDTAVGDGEAAASFPRDESTWEVHDKINDPATGSFRVQAICVS